MCADFNMFTVRHIGRQLYWRCRHNRSGVISVRCSIPTVGRLSCQFHCTLLPPYVMFCSLIQLDYLIFVLYHSKGVMFFLLVFLFNLMSSYFYMRSLTVRMCVYVFCYCEYTNVNVCIAVLLESNDGVIEERYYHWF